MGVLRSKLRDSTRTFGQLEILTNLGDRTMAPSVAARLADVLHRAGRLEETLGLAREAERDTFADDLEGQQLWRTPMAKILAAQGSPAEAERLSNEAAEIMETTDEINNQAEAWLGLAEVRAISSSGDARSAAREALTRFTAKGNVVRARHAQAT